jgi:hypothetical protein
VQETLSVMRRYEAEHPRSYFFVDLFCIRQVLPSEPPCIHKYGSYTALHMFGKIHMHICMLLHSDTSTWMHVSKQGRVDTSGRMRSHPCT